MESRSPLNRRQLLEAQRIQQRTNYDIEMLREVGYHRHRKLQPPAGRAVGRLHAVDAARLLPARLAARSWTRAMTVRFAGARCMYNGDR